MAFSKFESLWQLMSEYTFEVNEECINNGLTCVICKNIIIDAYQSECECQYCYKCIENHLKGENMKYCPGNKEICQEEYLELGRNVSRNPVLNRKVSNLKAKCPKHSCLYNIELIQMEEHLRVCTKQRLTCPYISIGCADEGGSKDSVLNHLHNDIFTHTKLLMECIQNIKNEFEGFEDNFKINKSEIFFLKEESRTKDRQIEEMTKKIKDLEREIVNIKDESIKKERENTERNLYTAEVMQRVMKEERELERINLRNELRIKEREINVNIHNKIEAMTKEMKEERQLIISSIIEESTMKEMKMKEIIENQNKEIKLLKDEFKELKNKREMKEEQSEEITEQIKKEREKNKKESVKNEEIPKEIKKNHELQKERHNKIKEKWKSIIKSTKLYSNVNADFIWQIDDLIIKKQTNKHYFSESFYSNDYKLCLSAKFGGDNIYLYCCVMKGDNDDKVQWPLNKSLTVGIVDQHNSTTYKSITQHYSEYKYEKEAFNRPQSDRNEYYIIFSDDNIKNYSPLAVYPPFIRHSSFMEEFIFNDFFIIFCVLF